MEATPLDRLEARKRVTSPPRNVSFPWTLPSLHHQSVLAAACQALFCPVGPTMSLQYHWAAHRYLLPLCSLLSGRHCLQAAHQVSLWTTVNRTKLRAFLRVQRAMQAAFLHNPHGEQTSPLPQLNIPSRQCCWWAEETRQCVYTVWSPLTSPKPSRQQWNSNTSYPEAHWSAEGHRLKINLAYLITF